MALLFAATPGPTPTPLDRDGIPEEWLFLISPEFWTAQAFALLIGISSGMATGLVVWWYLTRRVRPRFVIHDTISVADDPTGGSGRREKFRVKIENLGGRAMRDVIVRANITYRKGNGNIQLLDVPIRSDPIPTISKHSGRTVNIKTEQVDRRDRSHFSTGLRRRLRAGVRISPARLLDDLGPESRLRVTVSALDDITGSRTVEVREFTAGQVTHDAFDGNGPK